MFCALPNASLTFAIAVNGGIITTSTSVISPTSRRNDSINRSDSPCVMFIFQLAATNFFVASLFFSLTRPRREALCLREFQRCAAAGGNKRHFRGEPGLFDRCHRVAAADNGRRPRLRHGFCDRDCAFAEFRNFKNAHRSVPQNRFSAGNFLLIKRDRCRADIHCLPSVRDSVLGRQAAGISHVRARTNFICLDHINRNEKLHAALLRQVQKLAREIRPCRIQRGSRRLEFPPLSKTCSPWRRR